MSLTGIFTRDIAVDSGYGSGGLSDSTVYSASPISLVRGLSVVKTKPRYKVKPRTTAHKKTTSSEGYQKTTSAVLPLPLNPLDLADATWTSLLELQTKLLSGEHLLVSQARYEQALSIKAEHKAPEHTTALRKSEKLVFESIGESHQLVRQFSEKLEQLNQILQRSNAGFAHEPNPEPGHSADRSRTESPLEDTISDSSDDSPLENPASERWSTRLSSEIGEDVSTDAPQIAGHSRSSGETPSTKNPLPDCQGHSTAEIAHARPSFKNSSQPPSPLNPSPVSPLSQEETEWKEAFQPAPPSRAGSNVMSPVSPSESNSVGTVTQHSLPEIPSVAHQRLFLPDQLENRPGAARELEAYLNRYCTPRTHPANTSPPSSFISSPHRVCTPQYPAPVLTPSSSFSSAGQGFNFPKPFATPSQGPHTTSGFLAANYNQYTDSLWLLICANEGKFTTKLQHLGMGRDIGPYTVTDRDFARSLREHYSSLNKKWYSMLRLRGLVSLDFVQLSIFGIRYAYDANIVSHKKSSKSIKTFSQTSANAQISPLAAGKTTSSNLSILSLLWATIISSTFSSIRKTTPMRALHTNESLRRMALPWSRALDGAYSSSRAYCRIVSGC